MDNGTSKEHSVSRRRVAQAAVGAAAAGAAALAATRIPALAGDKTTAAADAASVRTTPPATSAPQEDWVVYVRDATTGDLDVFVGMRQVTVRDPDLVARLIAAAH
jgi:hypothetical protein